MASEDNVKHLEDCSVSNSVGVTYNVVVTNEHECLTIHEGIVDTQEQREMRILGGPYASINYGVDPPVDHPYINDSQY